MHISGLHIDSFGIFRNQGLQGIGPGLSVFLGANESGKSTLLEFVRWILFGSGEKPPPPPLEGGRIGGRLRLQLGNGRETLVERTEGLPAPDVDLFGGLDRRGFERIFALSLDDLQGFGVLDDEEQRGRLHSASQGLGTADLQKIRRRLEKEIRASLTQRGTRATVNGARGRLRDLERRVRQSQLVAARHTRLGRETLALEAAGEECQRQLAALEERLASLDLLRRAAAPWKRWQEAKRHLRRAGGASDPEGSRHQRRPVAGLPGAAALLVALLCAAVGVGLFASGLLQPAGAAALAAAGAGAGGSLYLLLHRGRQRMIQARRDRQLTLEAHRHRSAFEALTEGDPALRQEIEVFKEADLDEAVLETEAESLREERRKLTRESQLGQQRLGAVAAEMESISQGPGPEEVLLKQQVQQRRLEQGVRRWATSVLSLSILDEAFRSFTEERTPRILNRAGELVSAMVGEDLRLAAELGEAPHLEATTLLRRCPTAWSSGLGDQIYLAVRLALAEELRREKEPFPFLLDDVFVRLDPRRQGRTLRCLVELSASRQIILFTSRPSLVQDLKRLLAEDSFANTFAQVVQLGQGTFSGPTEARDSD